MTSLHGLRVLTELVMHPEREPGYETGWMVDEHFDPVVGKTYQIAFGRIPFGRELKNVFRTVRIDGRDSTQWYDVNENRYLEQGINEYSIKAFRCVG
jgi:hypothetical protein